MEPERKREKKTSKLVPAVIVCINIAISCMAAYTFICYVNNNREMVHEVAMQGVTEQANIMTRQLERYMISQNDLLSRVVGEHQLMTEKGILLDADGTVMRCSIHPERIFLSWMIHRST